MPAELTNVSRVCDNGLRRRANGMKSDLVIIEPGQRSLIVSHRPGRNCLVSSESSVMDPCSRALYEIKVQVEIEMGQRCRRLVIESGEDKFAIGRRHIEHQLQRLDPGLINLFATRCPVPVAKL